MKIYWKYYICVVNTVPAEILAQVGSETYENMAVMVHVLWTDTKGLNLIRHS